MPFPRLDTTLDADTAAIVGEQRISADSHMAEPPDLFQKGLPARYRERAPQFPNVKLYESFQHKRAGGWDPHERLRDQAYDGISAEVLYPTLGYAALATGDPELDEACVRAYNDWLIEFCSIAPDRFWGLGLVALWNIDHAIAELERCKRAGLRGAAIGLVPAPDLPYSSEHYDRFWAACQDLGMSINMHINSGPGARHAEQRLDAGPLPRGVHKHKLDCWITLGHLIGGGVLERYPGLNVVFGEAGVGWIPFFAQEYDYYQNRFSGSGAALPRPPSEYIYRQVYGAFISDEVGGLLLTRYGQDTFMWSNDYPHPACLWPISARAIAHDLGHLTPEVRQKVTSGTAARLYNGGILPPEADPPGEVQDMSSWEQHWNG
jgi:predicted TIM-barrel fold metal-dependent hydrolase